MNDTANAVQGFHRVDGTLHCDQVSLVDLAERFGTPLYVYSEAVLQAAWRRFDQAFGDHPHLICYAIKANSNLAVLASLAQLGSGFDIVSAGELKRVLAAGGQASRTVFSGVGKTVEEMAYALEQGVRCFNVESAAELARLQTVAAAHGVMAPVSLRINPDVDAETHPYISTGLRENKFGIPTEDALALYRQAAAASHLEVGGIDCHIGSQLVRIDPYRDAIRHLLALVDQLAMEGIHLHHLDVGGGQGIRYQDESPFDVDQWASMIREEIADRPLEILLEPGRAIAGPAGVLLGRVEYLKSNGSNHFAVTDTAMNDLIRPSLYGAWMKIEALRERDEVPERRYDVVGPVCESTDFLGKSRDLRIEAGELIAVRDAGAYSFAMSSNYNTRTRAAEVLVGKQGAALARRRETLDELLVHESSAPALQSRLPLPPACAPLAFSKMQGLGNDFMVIDNRDGSFVPDAECIRRHADRHTGIGFDQLLLVEAASVAEAAFDYRIFNADGHEVEQCGNGARCFARFVREQHICMDQRIVVNTRAGLLELKHREDGQVTVAMGVPKFAPSDVPFMADSNEALLQHTFAIDGVSLQIGVASLGNPHVLIEPEQLDDETIARLGPLIESDPRFPKRVNVGFMQRLAENHIRLRVFERGVGETRACGSGACAAVAIAHRQGRVGRHVTVSLPGGELEIHWPADDAQIEMTGPCSTVFAGHTRM